MTEGSRALGETHKMLLKLGTILKFIKLADEVIIWTEWGTSVRITKKEAKRMIHSLAASGPGLVDVHARLDTVNKLIICEKEGAQ